MCSNISWCFNRSDFERRFNHVLLEKNVILDRTSKEILKNRYVKLVSKLEIAAKRSNFWFLWCSTITTVGSILVPALLSIQDRTFKVDSSEEAKENHENNVYWATWGISLGVTLSNACVRLFNFDKTSVTRKLRMNHLKSEGWLFLEMAGDYSRFTNHQEAFQTFCNNIEKIKTEQVKEVYTHNNSFGTPSYDNQNRAVRDETMV